MKTYLLASALLFAAVLPAQAGDPRPSRDIVDTAVAAGRFSTLVAALKAAGLVETLKSPGPFTVFAPTDEAFAALPQGTVATLLKPENKAALTRVLTFHVVAGRVLSTDLLPTPSAATVAGPALTFGLKVGGADVVAADILCSNGVIHVIDRVLLPPEAPAMSAAKPGVSASDRIRAAINAGAPMFNAGDHAGCARLYAATAQGLVDAAVAEAGVVGELHAMDLAEALRTHHADAADQAWALRRVFDRVLEDEAFAARIEAPMPAGFPAAGPVGRVVTKQYPAYRAARSDGSSAFWTLFSHIKQNDVEMTAPVEMTMEQADGELRTLDMAFLYERPDQGAAGAQGRVQVLDLPSKTVLSIGMRGDRTERDVARAQQALEQRLAQDGLKAAGPYRLMGYNSPMVAAAQRFWELQVPVQRSAP